MSKQQDHETFAALLKSPEILKALQRQVLDTVKKEKFAIYINSLHDLHAMPSLDVAFLAADLINAEFCERSVPAKAEVVIWPFSDAMHEAETKNFDYAAWGLKEDVTCPECEHKVEEG